MTVKEYGEWCASIGDDNDDNDDQTWGEWRQEIRNAERAHDGIKPPAEVKAFHDVRRNAFDVIGSSAFLKEKPADEIANHFEIIFIPEVLVMAHAMGTSEDLLPDDVRDILIETGCLDEDEDE